MGRLNNDLSLQRMSKSKSLIVSFKGLASFIVPCIRFIVGESCFMYTVNSCQYLNNITIKKILNLSKLKKNI